MRIRSRLFFAQKLRIYDIRGRNYHLPANYRTIVFQGSIFHRYSGGPYGMVANAPFGRVGVYKRHPVIRENPHPCFAEIPCIAL